MARSVTAESEHSDWIHSSRLPVSVTAAVRVARRCGWSTLLFSSFPLTLLLLSMLLYRATCLPDCTAAVFS